MAEQEIKGKGEGCDVTGGKMWKYVSGGVDLMSGKKNVEKSVEIIMTTELNQLVIMKNRTL